MIGLFELIAAVFIAILGDVLGISEVFGQLGM